MLIGEDGNFLLNNIIEYPVDNYDNLKTKAVDCSRCHLREKCTRVVMGEGSIDNHLMFIGEGPGRDEDRQGRPFVGRAGQLLNKILAAVNIERSSVYITNIVKCRPPGNRTPTFEEAKACSPILEAEIKLINPKVIVPLGSAALKFLIDKEASITRMRGKWLEKGDLYILPTFHPAYLLRNANMKKHVWRDFKVIKKSVDRIGELKQQGKL